MSWRATYEKRGCPKLVISGLERATFRGDSIELLEDLMEEGAGRRMQDYLERHLR